MRQAYLQPEARFTPYMQSALHKNSKFLSVRQDIDNFEWFLCSEGTMSTSTKKHDAWSLLVWIGYVVGSALCTQVENRIARAHFQEENFHLTQKVGDFLGWFIYEALRRHSTLTCFCCLEVRG